MRAYFRLSRLCLSLLILILSFSCKKTSSPDTNPPNDPLPAITPVGTPVGNPVSKNIGAAGGTLVSPDGRLELNIPAGALSSNTTIAIQPVTNEAPGGIGLSYDLLPNGTTFSKPATIKFHYTDDELMGNDPIFLCVAYQNNSNKWITNLKQQHLDSTAKTLSLAVSHFTIFSGLELGVKIEASPRSVKAGKTSRVRVWEVLVRSERVSEYVQIADRFVSDWRVGFALGGNGTDGTITGSGSAVTYHAPASISQRKNVRVSAHINIALTVHYQGAAFNFPNGFESSVEITLEPAYKEFKYNIAITVLDSTISGFYGGLKEGLPVYLDTANFKLNPQGG